MDRLFQKFKVPLGWPFRLDRRRLAGVSLIFLLLACMGCAPSAGEGFVNTPDGVRLFYKIVGNGPQTLVVVHGGPGNSLMSIMPDLVPLATDRRVIYYDQRGSGRSDLVLEKERLSISRHVEDLEAVRKHFHIDKLTLLGNSWGGMLVSFYAAAHPERVDRIVLHSPGEPRKDFLAKADREMQTRLDRELTADARERYAFLSEPENWIGASDPKAMCREYYQLLLPFFVFDPRSVNNLKGDLCWGPDDAVRHQQFVSKQIIESLGDWDLLPSLETVKAPVLVIYGAKDPAFVETPQAWARAFPNGRLLIIEKAGHIPHVEQAKIFFDAVETFLKG